MKRGLLGCFFVFILGIGLILGCNESRAGQAAAEKPTISEQAAAAAPSPGPQPAGPAKAAAQASEADKNKPESADGPKILVTKAFHDFGEIGPGTYHTCEFTFKNVGTKTLKIENIQSTCGCSVPQLKKNDYEPGESGTVEVRFHSPTINGETKKQLYIISNDSSNPRALLELRAFVAVKVQTEPTEVSLQLNKPNAGLGKITVKCTDNQPFAITKFSTSPDGVMSCAVDPQKKATEFVLEPQVNLEMLSKNPMGVMTIEVDHPQGGAQLVRYQALPKYEVSRPRIILQNVKPGQKEQKEVVITSHYGDSLKIAKSSSRTGLMKVGKQEIKENALTLTIEITMPEKEASGRRYFSDELTIQFDNSEEVVIRASGWFQN
jgi:hypothetical protein